MKRWILVLTLVSAMLLSGVTSVAAKTDKDKSGSTDVSGPIYPGGIFDLR